MYIAPEKPSSVTGSQASVFQASVKSKVVFHLPDLSWSLVLEMYSCTINSEIALLIESLPSGTDADISSADNTRPTSR